MDALRMELSGRKALVTGGAVRIGRAICERLAERGVDVVIHYQNSGTEAEELCEELKSKGVAAWTVSADLSSGDDCVRLIDQVQKETGGLDFLVNNAAVFLRDTLADLDVEEAMGQIKVNLMAPLVLMRRFVEICGKGKIVNLLDRRVAGWDPEHLSYTLSKKALAEATLAAAREWAPAVTVNAVAPGAILPPSGEGDEYLREKAGHVPLERDCTVNDVADAVTFLLESDALTGQILYVDGGQHLVNGSSNHAWR